MNRSRLAALSAGAMFLVATVLAPVATADNGGTNTIKVSPATTTVATPGSGSFSVTIVANGGVDISGAGMALNFDNTKLQLTDLATDATVIADGAQYIGFPTAAQKSTFLSNANTNGHVPNISWAFPGGSCGAEPANTNRNIVTLTFSVLAVGDNTLALDTTVNGVSMLDGSTSSPGVCGPNYGQGLTVTPTNGSVVNHVAPVFSISANPGSVSVNRGSNTNASPITVHTAATAGTPGSVNLSATGLPSGVTATFTPTSVNPNVAASQDSSLTFAATAAATTGTATVTITGVDSSDGTDTHSTTIQLTVVAPNDFSLAATPPSVTVSAGGASGSTQISVNQVTPTAGTVTLTITSSAIAGVTTTLTNGSATTSTADTLTINASGSAVPGSYTVTVSGDNGTNVHAVNITLTVNGAAPPNAQDVNVNGTMDGGFIGLTCPTAVNLPLLRGNTNQANVPCVVYTNTMWALAVNDTATDASKGFLVTGRPVDNTTNFSMPDSMHVLANSFISGGDVFYHNDVNLTAGGTILTGTNSANAPVVLSQFVRANTHPGTYSIQLLFSAMSTF